MVKVNTSGTPEWKKIQDGFSTEGLEFVFRELLGWGLDNPKVLPCVVDEETFSPKVVADLAGYRIFLVEAPTLPSPKMQAQIDSKLSLQAPERITIFSDGSTMQWRWPHQTPSGGVSYESLSINASTMPSFLAQRLVGLRFTVQDFTRGVSLVDVRDRVRGRFDGAKVTKKFFDEFRKHHQHLASSIEGLGSEEDRSAYATLLMNRLMLLYFLQKREFLNDDPFYLENCLTQVQQSKGQDKFYSFYRDLLLPMFFDRLAAFAPKELEPEVARIIGDIPYINGGIYEPSPVEKEFGGELNVPDEEFEIVLGFFGKFNWHLDTRPSGSENEINPEVIGYIFEQYINYTAGGKKDNGAYYTKEDVTGYMVGSTLIPRILDYCVELEIPFLDLVAENPLRYIHADMLHGFEMENKIWSPAPARLEEVWADDPIHWHELDDAESDSAINLPGESWVETFYRRERVDKLTKDLSGGLVRDVNDLITHNLNSRLLLTDAIDRLETLEIATNLWAKVTSLSVLDPTCGSGAFLFAAMEALEDVYHHLISAMRAERSESGIAEKITAEIQRHPNERYFVRKSVAINNLYGVDIMEDAVNTAQLRIFLALVSCLESREEIEPLPALDFNLKPGNLLVGVRDLSDLDRFSDDLFFRSSLEALEPSIENYRILRSRFVYESSSNRDSSLEETKNALRELASNLRLETNSALGRLGGSAGHSSESLEQSQPFHWFIEFPEIFEKGGFDVVVGNPPYIERQFLTPAQRGQLNGYATSGCPNIYAACVERSLQLVSSDGGRASLVVMLSLAVGEAYGPLRRVFSKFGLREWWSTFGKDPSGLFSGARVRNTIIVLGNGSGRAVTRHHIFSGTTRPWLFTCLQYFPQGIRGENPPLRGGLASAISESISQATIPAGVASQEEVYVKPSGAYWFPVLGFWPSTYGKNLEVLDPRDPNIKRVRLKEGESKDMVISALAGKVGYLWWIATGDNYNASPSQTEAIRGFVLASAESAPNLKERSRQVVEAFPRAAILVNNKKLFPNVRWTDLRQLTDLFDLDLLRGQGLEKEWRNLHIWYRQVMRSSGASSKDFDVTEEFKTKMLRGSTP